MNAMKAVNSMDLTPASELISQEPDGRAPDDERALRAAVDACARDYPNAARGRIEHLMRSFYALTSDAKVKQYRVLLAERDTRVRLRLEERARRDDDIRSLVRVPGRTPTVD